MTMSETVTFEAVVGEGQEIVHEVYDYEYSGMTTLEYINLILLIEKFYIPFTIVVGVSCNILALLILIRCRLWLHHEAYIYLAAILIVNVATLILRYGDYWLRLFDHPYVRLPISSDIICKLWMWVLHTIHYIDWMFVLMLLNVYLRQQLITSNERRGCYMNLAVKYCTLFGTKVVIGSFFTVCAVASFWGLSVSSLDRNYGPLDCHISRLYHAHHALLYLLMNWMAVISLVIILPVLMLAVWKRWKSSFFVFNEMNGATEDNGDAQVTARIVVFCSAAILAVKVPLIFNFIVRAFNLWSISNTRFIEAIFTMNMIAVSHPLSTPIVCFALNCKFRKELRAIVDRCCNGCCSRSWCHRTPPVEADSSSNSVLQMDIIDGNLPVTRREEDFEPIRQ